MMDYFEHDRELSEGLNLFQENEFSDDTDIIGNAFPNLDSCSWDNIDVPTEEFFKTLSCDILDDKEFVKKEEDLDVLIDDISANDSSSFVSDNADFQFASKIETGSTGVSSPETLDAISDVSETSDLGSMASVSSPTRSNQDSSLVLDYPSNNEYIFKGEERASEKLIFIPASNENVIHGQQKMKLELPQNPTTVRTISLKSFSQKEPIVVSPPANFTNSQQSGLLNQKNFIFTAQKGTASAIRNGNTYLKTTGPDGKSFFVPCSVKDINQVPTHAVQTVKVINGSNRPIIKTGVRIISPASQKNISPKTTDGKPVLKVGPMSINRTSSTITVKEDDETPQNGQELKLSDEERRLLKKEGIVLPTHYPLSKEDDRNLKRIKRKIRNKISAQDSRKRKKEYVDNLEERLKSVDMENLKLTKKVRTLETQNEYLASQLNRLKNLLGNGVGNRQSAHSTALMMLILSAALIVIPSLRPQDAKEGELSAPNSPPSGQTRTLLEAGVPLNLGTQDVEEDIIIEEFNAALSDHDYAPLSKKPRLESPTYPEFEMLEKKACSEGEPPDGMLSFFAAFFNRLSKNWTMPNQIGAKEVKKIPVGLNTFHASKDCQSVVVNLNAKGKMIEELELE